jgi:hypothetical protein
MSFGIPQRRPLGLIHAGPVHTLHFADGSPAEDRLYWYDPQYFGDRPLFKGDEKWRDMEKKRLWAMKRLAGLRHRSDVEALLVRYAEALDQPSPDVAFLQLWSILEKVTGTIDANYDETIKRAVWWFSSPDRALARNLLESLRCRRNQYVHSGKPAQEGDQCAYLIKSFLDPHLLRLIENRFKLGSLEEYGEILRLPTDIDTLEKKRRRLSQALRVQRQPEPPEE